MIMASTILLETIYFEESLYSCMMMTIRIAHSVRAPSSKRGNANVEGSSPG